MQDFYREIEENININRTFSIEDISEQNNLHRFFIIGDDIEIENILEDTEFLPEKICIDNQTQTQTSTNTDSDDDETNPENNSGLGIVDGSDGGEENEY
jgi:hypothetical protein